MLQNIIFLIQRGWKVYNGKLTLARFYRCFVESMIWFLSVYIVIHYMPVIHPEFNMRSVFEIDPMMDILLPLVPNSVKEYTQPYLPGMKSSMDGLWSSFCSSVVTRYDEVTNYFYGEWVIEGEVKKYNFTGDGWLEV